MNKSIFLNKDEREYRKSLCDSCEKKNGFRCEVCGCFLIALQKVRRFECPLEKWDTDSYLP